MTESENQNPEEESPHRQADSIQDWLRSSDNMFHVLMRQLGYDPRHWNMTISRSLFAGLQLMARQEQEEMTNFQRKRATGHYDLEHQLELTDRVQVLPDMVLQGEPHEILFQNRHDENVVSFTDPIFQALCARQ